VSAACSAESTWHDHLQQQQQQQQQFNKDLMHTWGVHGSQW
jgi:hypothetical protein